MSEMTRATELERKFDIPLYILNSPSKMSELIRAIETFLENSKTIVVTSSASRHRVFRFYDTDDRLLLDRGATVKLTTYKNRPQGDPRRYRLTIKVGPVATEKRTECTQWFTDRPTAEMISEIVSSLGIISTSEPLVLTKVAKTFDEQQRYKFDAYGASFILTIDGLYPPNDMKLVPGVKILDPYFGEIEIEAKPTSEGAINIPAYKTVCRAFRRKFLAKSFPLVFRQKYERLMEILKADPTYA